MGFEGWTPEAFDVLARLEGDPTPSLRETVRADREQLVRAPMVSLLDELAARNPAYEDRAVWRYGTMAYWWQNQGATIRIDRKVDIGFNLDVDGLRITGAWWYADPGQRERYRAAVAGRPGARLQHIVDDLDRTGFTVRGNQLVRVPKGYPPDHPRVQLLRRTELRADQSFPLEDWFFTAEVADRVEMVLTELRPLMEWLSDHVAAGFGPP